jgi:hypothetical protein
MFQVSRCSHLCRFVRVLLFAHKERFLHTSRTFEIPTMKDCEAKREHDYEYSLRPVGLLAGCCCWRRDIGRDTLQHPRPVAHADISLKPGWNAIFSSRGCLPGHVWMRLSGGDRSNPIQEVWRWKSGVGGRSHRKPGLAIACHRMDILEPHQHREPTLLRMVGDSVLSREGGNERCRVHLEPQRQCQSLPGMHGHFRLEPNRLLDGYQCAAEF